jgi:hypothetical protein
MPAPLSGRQAEARRNDRLILEGAREVFVEDPDAPISAVAERAGVGIGTLYRRYASKEERFIERVKDRVVEVPATEEIEHKEIGEYWGETPEGHFYPHFGEHEELIDRLETYYEYALLTAAGVYNKTGSLDIVASALGHAGFQPPFGYEAEDENDHYVGKEALPFWIGIDENRNRILGLIDSTPAKAIARGETLE